MLWLIISTQGTSHSAVHYITYDSAYETIHNDVMKETTLHVENICYLLAF